MKTRRAEFLRLPFLHARDVFRTSQTRSIVREFVPRWFLLDIDMLLDRFERFYLIKAARAHKYQIGVAPPTPEQCCATRFT